MLCATFVVGSSGHSLNSCAHKYPSCLQLYLFYTLLDFILLTSSVKLKYEPTTAAKSCSCSVSRCDYFPSYTILLHLVDRAPPTAICTRSACLKIARCCEYFPSELTVYLCIHSLITHWSSELHVTDSISTPRIPSCDSSRPDWVLRHPHFSAFSHERHSRY